MHETLDAAIKALEVAIADVVADFGDEGGDAYVYDLAVATAYDCTPEIARELCRTQLGFIPDVIENM